MTMAKDKELILMNLVLNLGTKQSEVKRKTGKDNIYCEDSNIVIAYIMMQVAHSEPYQRFKIECFGKMVKS